MLVSFWVTETARCSLGGRRGLFSNHDVIKEETEGDYKVEVTEPP
jgi:hypothetical protein